MILNHKDAILHLIDNVDTIDISAKTVKSIQAHLSKNLLQDDWGVGGIRQTPVQITGTAYIPLAVPSDLENELLRICGKAAAIENPFEQSLFLLADRKSVVSGKSVSVRVDLGGSRIIKKKNIDKKVSKDTEKVKTKHTN